MKKVLRAIIILTVLSFVLVIGGCGNDANRVNPNDNGSADKVANVGDTGSDKPDTNNSLTSDYGSIKLSPEDAFDLFKEKYPQAKVTEVEIERKGTTYIYEVDGYVDNLKHEVKIDSEDGKILKTDTEKSKAKEVEILREDLSKIPKFVDETLNDAGEGFRVEEWSLEAEKQGLILEIELIDANNVKSKYKYNYQTGNLIKKK